MRSGRAAAALLLVIGAQPARAQTAVQPEAATGLTIDQAVREAVDRNLTVVAERYSVSIAEARIATARLRPNPVFTYDTMLPDSTIYDRNVNPLEHVLRGDFVLEGGGKRARRIEVATVTRSVAELQFLNTMRGIVLDVERAFVEVLLAKANVALARDSLAAFEGIVKINTERVRTGDLSQVELSRSQLAALQFQNDVRQQESKLAVARTKLKALLGRAGDESIDVTGEFRREASPIALEVVRQQALERRPDILALRQDNARSAAELRLQIAQAKIDYTVSAEYHWQRAPAITGRALGLFFSVPFPLFNRNQGEIERARQEQNQTAARVHALETDIGSEVASAYAQYASSRDILDTIERQMLARAREVRTTTEYSYRRGEASFVEFLDAVRAFNDTMQSYNEARADYARSLYSLDSVSGKGQP